MEAKPVSASRSETMALLGHARLLTDFDHVVCKEDAAQTKPAADVVCAVQLLEHPKLSVTFAV